MLKVGVFALCVAMCYADYNGIVRMPSSDNDDQVFRPCPLDDYKCIGDSLASNSNCSQDVVGFLEPLKFVPFFTYETPHFNSSVIETKIVRNVDKCHVSEFFFNLRTDTSVLTIDCPNVVMEANRTVFQHYTAQEDTTYSYIFNGTYPLLRFTVNMKHTTKLDLCNSFVFADVAALPHFVILPNDKSSAEIHSQDFTDLHIYEREAFRHRAHNFMRYFVRRQLCNFGC